MTANVDGKNEQSINVSDPVKVMITVVQGQNTTSSSSSSGNRVNDLVNSFREGTSPTERSITISDPLQVTIKLVPDSNEKKSITDESTSSLTNVTDWNLSEKTTMPTTRQPAFNQDPTTLSSADIAFLAKTNANQPESRKDQSPTDTEQKRAQESTATPLASEAPTMTTTSSSTPLSSSVTAGTGTGVDPSKQENRAHTAFTDEDMKKQEAPISSAAAPTSATPKNQDQPSSPDEHSTSSLKNTSLRSSSPSSSSKKEENAKDFRITKGNAKNLTSFQRKKAEYFFNVNLDIENKKFLTWDDVEFYLLFHVTAAGKQGANNGDLEARLSRAARSLWEHIFDQIPSSDGKREKLTLEQFLDVWASLIDYIVKHGQLPDVVQELVNLGFQLYSTDGSTGKSATISATAFERLFQKMNLNRPYALAAYKFLTENETKPLDSDRINSIVRAVITSSDDAHPSHFLLPGFFKTVSEQHVGDATRKGIPSPSGGDQSNDSNKQGPTSSPTLPRTTSPKQSDSSEKPKSPTNAPSPQQQPDRSISPRDQFTVTPLTPEQERELVQQLDNNIRNLLRYYHIDDGDLVEVADNQKKRLILVHPERPLPAYIQQDANLLNLLRASGVDVPQRALSPQQENKKPIEKRSPSPVAASKITLEDRVNRGEVHVGPTVPIRQETAEKRVLSPGIREVSPSDLEDQSKTKARSPSPKTTSTAHETPKKVEDSTVKSETKTVTGPTTATRSITSEEGEVITDVIVKQLTPFAEDLVAEEIFRIKRRLSGQTDVPGFFPFPFMFSGGGPMFSATTGGGSASSPHQTNNQAGARVVPSDESTTTINNSSSEHQGDNSFSSHSSGSRPAATNAESFTVSTEENHTIGNRSQP